MLQSDIGDIYTGTTFKNGEALVITKDNRYCVINTSGQLLKIDNNIVLSFDEYYAIGQHADKSAKGTKSRIVYDGPTVYSEDDLYGYKQEAPSYCRHNLTMRNPSAEDMPLLLRIINMVC